MSVKFTDNSDEVLAAFEEACLRGLEKCGLVAEGYAKKLQHPDTGLLRNSITHAISGKEPAIKTYEANRPKAGRKNEGSYSGTAPEEPNGFAVYIGTNVKYGVFQEYGTGIYAEGGGGRPTSWSYEDANGGKHWTGGHRAQPFIKPAVADHQQTYKNIIKDELENGYGGHRC